MELVKYRIVRMSRGLHEVFYVVEENSYGFHWNEVANGRLFNQRQAEERIEQLKLARTPWKKEVVREYS